MDGNTRTFTLQETQFRHGAIDAAIGTIGSWPFRRTISYHTGVNCDAIAVQDGRLHVLRRGRSIAVAELTGKPSPLARLLRAIRRTLLPDHLSDSTGPEWEDLLRTRRRK